MTHPVTLPPEWAHNRFLLEMLREPEAVHGDAEAVVVEHRGPRGRGFIALGDPHGAAALLSRTDPGSFTSAHMPRGTWGLMAPALRDQFRLPRTEDWDWLDISHVPQVEGSERVREVDLAEERGAVERVKGASIPDSFLTLDSPGVRWYGWEDQDGHLRAIGGAMGHEDGVWRNGAHFGSIGTEPGWEGRGIGSALTAGMIRLAFGEGATRASLGVYVGNDRAIAMYERLGFTTGFHVHSRHARD